MPSAAYRLIRAALAEVAAKARDPIAAARDRMCFLVFMVRGLS